jgi:hypothetical protein
MHQPQDTKETHDHGKSKHQGKNSSQKHSSTDTFLRLPGWTRMIFLASVSPSNNMTLAALSVGTKGMNCVIRQWLKLTVEARRP